MSQAAIPRVMVPLAITDAMLTSCTIAEPAAGETAWVSGGTYAIGDVHIRATTHMRYKSITAHTGVTTLPENDPINWYPDGPTLRWAALDLTESTVSSGVTSIQYVFSLGFFSSVAVMGVRGAGLTVTVSSDIAGGVYHTHTADLTGPFLDEWDWFWGPERWATKHIIDGVLPYPDAVLTVTVSAGTGSPVSIGSILIGAMVPLIIGDWGGTQYGAQATPVDFSWVDVKKDGTWKVVPGRKATDIHISAILPQKSAAYANGVVQSISGPTVLVATTTNGYGPLTGLGILKSAPLTFQSANHAEISIEFTGLI